MSLRLTCSGGHEWEIADTSERQSASCPICGGLPNTLLTHALLPAADAEALAQTNPDPLSPPARQSALAIPGYEVLSELGRGGAGVVYLARQVALDRLVALKMLLSGPYAGKAELARFHSEAEAIARLRHPHIVQIHDLGEADGRPYFALEYLTGGSLSAKLKRQPQPARQAAELLRTLAQAVHFAHQCGILHRDLKPGNVLLDADGTPKIADFGLARRLDLEAEGLRERWTPSGAVMGTPSYMAPEQARGQTRAFTAAIDIYALGGILYEMLTGRPPFVGESISDTLMQVIDAEPLAPRRLNPRVPRDLETICLHCLQKRPTSRYATAADLADDLDRFLNHRPIRARPVGRLERILKWTRRRPAQAALFAVIALAFALGAAGSAWHQLQLQHKNVELQQALNAEERQKRRNVELLRLSLDVESGYGDYVDEQLKPLPHLTDIRRRLLEKRFAFYRPILAQEPNDPQMRQTQGLAHLAVAVLRQKQEQFDEAETSYRTALERLNLPEEEASPDSRRSFARARVQYATLLTTRKRLDDADRHLHESEQLLERLMTEAPEAETRHALALAYHNRALVLAKKGQAEAARQSYEDAIRLRRQLSDDDPNDDRYPRELAGSYLNLNALYLHLQQPEPARAALLQAETLLLHLPPDVENRALLAGLYVNLGILDRERAPEQSLSALAKALALWSKLAEQFPDVADYRRRTASTHFLLGMGYITAGRLDAAERAFRRHLALSSALIEQKADNREDRHERSKSLYYLSQIAAKSRRFDEAEALGREQRLVLEELLRQQPDDAELHRSLAYLLGELGDLDRVRGIRWRMAPAWTFIPSPPQLGFALHALASLTMGHAYLERAAAVYRLGMKEERLLLKLDSPQAVRHFTGLSRHALALAVVAEQRASYQDMRDAAEGVAEAAQGLSAAPDEGRLFRLAAGCTAHALRLLEGEHSLSVQERQERTRRHAADALALLHRAVAAGFRNVADLQRTPAFAPLRTMLEFQKLLAAVKERQK